MKKKFGAALILMVVMLFTSIKCFAEVVPEKSEAKNESTNTIDIVEIATKDGRFKTLVTALNAADLVDTLKGEGPFTVFAPVDAAFNNLPKETLDNLLKPENKSMLEGVLTYHVTPGKLSSEELTKFDGKQIAMANGDKINIEIKDGEVFVNGAKVIVKDIQAKNGVIHAIDAVLLPKEKK